MILYLKEEDGLNPWKELLNCTLPDVQLGIAFEHVDRKFKVEHSGVTYYPINCEYGMVKKIRNKIIFHHLNLNMKS
mgnify:CR=1 FL=1